jgi:transcriptional regulator with XRE-family HTH domain
MSKASFVNRPITHLLFRARRATGMTQEELGNALRVSKRTVARWETGQAYLGVNEVRDLVRLVHPQDRALAAELASSASESLESLGLEVSQAPPPLPSHLVVDAVVCAAADALEAAPNTVRAALHAAFKRARDLRLSVDDVEKALSPAAARKAAKAGKAAS